MNSTDSDDAMNYPYVAKEVQWNRPDIDRKVLAECNRRSDALGLLYSFGTLAILGTTGAAAYILYNQQQWLLMAIALYIHGGVHAFQPQRHEFSHGTVFKTKWLNQFFERLFGLVFWTGNSALYKMSHVHHHRYTLHRCSDGEVVLPSSETTQDVFKSFFRVVDITGMIATLFDQVYTLMTPFPMNPGRSTWFRYVYAISSPGAKRDFYWTHVSQLLFHVLFSIWAIAVGKWFLVVVVTLPAFYGGKWYAMLVHDTMHAGRQSETDDFKKCCRSVKLDPLTSFLYWRMEYHVEHHAFAAVPCYHMRRFHNLTRNQWDAPQTLLQAWREMNFHARKHLCIPTSPGSLQQSM